MTATTDTRTIDVDLRTDIEANLPGDVPRAATIEIDYGSRGKTVTVDHGQEEWTFEFEDGQCVDRDPATRPIPPWLSEAMELVKSEVR